MYFEFDVLECTPGVIYDPIQPLRGSKPPANISYRSICVSQLQQVSNTIVHYTFNILRMPSGVLYRLVSNVNCKRVGSVNDVQAYSSIVACERPRTVATSSHHACDGNNEPAWHVAGPL